MATKPTRQQEQAGQQLAEILNRIAAAARLDGQSPLSPSDFGELARRVARISSAFSVDELLGRSLELRGQALGLRPGTAELLALLDDGSSPLEALWLPDEDFRKRVEKVDQELGEF